jgi:regulator of nucleoside diphosphate kinase
MPNKPRLTVTIQDFDRIQDTLHAARGLCTDQLEQEISCAKLVDPEDISPQVVTMNSELIYEDVATGVRRNLRLVYPHEADADRGWVSVLAPLGNAVIGLREGQQIDWVMPGGARRLKIVEITYQPEAAGDWSL